jgi:hypothetical protein
MRPCRAYSKGLEMGGTSAIELKITGDTFTSVIHVSVASSINKQSCALKMPENVGHLAQTELDFDGEG